MSNDDLLLTMGGLDKNCFSGIDPRVLQPSIALQSSTQENVFTDTVFNMNRTSNKMPKVVMHGLLKRKVRSAQTNHHCFIVNEAQVASG